METSPLSATPAITPVSEDTVYFALNTAGRRQFIRRLAMDRIGLTASEAFGARIYELATRLGWTAISL